MRPIDADALINEIKKETEKAIEQDDKVGSFWLGYAAGLVIKQPTIQPEKAQLSQEGATSDLISRQAAIDAINSWRGRFSEEYNEAIDDCENSIKELPIIQPEPKEGHWIPHETPDGGEQYECSRCGVLWEFTDGTPEDNEAYFCPNCGAKMKGERQK